ncbi:hypothetical protein ACFWU3_36295 [Streptomyces sp. NPDC058685]
MTDRPTRGVGATGRTPYYHYRKQPQRYQQFNRDYTRLRHPAISP